MAPKPRTAAQIERETDLRLIRTYGITLAEYDSLLASQGGVCAICGGKPGSRRLNTDHCHRFAKLFSVAARKSPSKQWMAYTVHKTDATHRFHISSLYYAKRAEAVAYVKRELREASVRGILCMHCNRGLRLFFDNPKSLERAAQYLRRFQER